VADSIPTVRGRETEPDASSCHFEYDGTQWVRTRKCTTGDHCHDPLPADYAGVPLTAGLTLSIPCGIVTVSGLAAGGPPDDHCVFTYDGAHWIKTTDCSSGQCNDPSPSNYGSDPKNTGDTITMPCR
jgi:hypothetical protein